MNSAIRWKLILAFALVFLAGIACGFFGSVHGFAWLVSHHARGSVAEHMKRHLRWELKLTPQQMEKIGPIIDRAGTQLEEKRQETAHDVHEIFQQAHQEIIPYLDDEQRARLQKMEERHRRMMHRRGFLAPPP